MLKRNTTSKNVCLTIKRNCYSLTKLQIKRNSKINHKKVSSLTDEMDEIEQEKLNNSYNLRKRKVRKVRMIM